MSDKKNLQVILSSRPQGKPKKDNFFIKKNSIPSLKNGEVLIKTIYLSLDPYMRGRMNPGKSYANPVEIGEVMVGGTVGRVIDSKNSIYNNGDFVFGYGGWQEFWVQRDKGLRKLDPKKAPISSATGILGMPGVTAYTGLLNIGKPKQGETVLVAAASGAVGSVVGQIARIKGARAVGIAGSNKKCEFVTKELGFDSCINHKSNDFRDMLKKSCPDGIDVYFENVGGKIFELVMPLLNNFARIPICGLISLYNNYQISPAPDLTPLIMKNILIKRLTIRGFIVWDFQNQEEEAINNILNWINEGKIRYREDFVNGLENATEAFIGLFEGENFGKLVVKVCDEDFS